MDKTKETTAAGYTTDDAWNRWVLQTARRWSDVEELIKKTGLETIDEDHRQLTEIALEVNNLIDLVDARGIQLDAIQEQGKAIQSMYDFAKGHFDREIEIIKKYRLPGLDVQLEQHEYFLNMLQGYLNDFNSGRLTTSMQLKNAVLDWWVTHINHVDNDSFSLKNWTKSAIKIARKWSDVEDIIRTTGIDTLDQEHRYMTEIALELSVLNDQHLNGDLSLTERAQVDTVLARLLSAAQQHFANEETFIQVFELSGIKIQKHQHENFLKMLQKARLQAAEGDPDVLLSVRQSILLWWISHINEIDYNSFSLDKWAHIILTASTSWEEASDFIRKTGEAVVDEDHQQITVFLLELDAIIQLADTSEDKDMVRKKSVAYFRDLYSLVENHFIHEEALMEDNKYLLLEIHKGQHQKFLTYISRIYQDLENDRISLSKSVKKKILEWWIEHIREYDLKAFNQSRFVDVSTEVAHG